jgi:hypothetical protein
VGFRIHHVTARHIKKQSQCSTITGSEVHKAFQKIIQKIFNSKFKEEILMSNGINSPFGLQIVESAIGNGGTQKLKPYFIYTDVNGANSQAVSIYSGDPVKFTPGAANAPTGGAIVAPFTNAAAAVPTPTVLGLDPNLGVFVSCTYTNRNGVIVESPYWPGGTLVMPGTQIIAYVNDDPMAVFRVQVSASTADGSVIFLNNMVGLNASLKVGGLAFTANQGANNPFTGNSVSGSAYYLDITSVVAPVAAAVTAVAVLPAALGDVKIIGIAPNTNLTSGVLVAGVTMPFVNVLVRFNNHVYCAGTPGRSIAAA